MFLIIGNASTEGVRVEPSRRLEAALRASLFALCRLLGVLVLPLPSRG